MEGKDEEHEASGGRSETVESRKISSKLGFDENRSLAKKKKEKADKNK